VVRFDPSIVRWVKERQHFTWVDEPASETTTTYRPRTFEQIEGWLLSWGDKMEVLEPAMLRERLAETARRIVEKHGESSRSR
jgi:predicted DNA-binding transcriptional regulator YafY